MSKARDEFYGRTVSGGYTCANCNFKVEKYVDELEQLVVDSKKYSDDLFIDKCILESENEALKVGSAEVGKLFLAEQQKNTKLDSEKAELIGSLGIALDDKKRKLYKSELIETLNKFKEK